jgi:radical SAM superfamily enzyme YgiQ (UPF0313 family)
VIPKEINNSKIEGGANLYVTFVIGTAGSGKSLLVSSFSDWLKLKKQNVITVNLDPGVIKTPYTPDVDVRDFISIDELMDKGYDSFYFQDDCFTIDKKRAIEIADRLKDRKITFRATSRTDTIDEELMGKLDEAGLRSISYGLEHFDDGVLKTIDKGNNVANHIKAIKCAHDNGIKVRGSFIVNLPGATKKTAYKTLEMAQDLDLEFADFYTLTAYPGTPLWNNPEHYGVKVNKDYKYYQLGFDTNVWTKGFGWKVEPTIRDIRRRWAEFRGLKCPWENCR